MNNKTDILLVNSLAPRQRIASDAALENSLALLRTYLDNQNLSAEICDYQRIDLVEQGVPKWCLAYLRSIVNLQIQLHDKSKSKLIPLFLLLLSWPAHALSLSLRKKYLDHIIQQIIDKVKTEHIPMVGIKVWYGDAFKWSKELSRRLRQHCPETIVVAGGPQVKVYGDYVIRNNEFDFAIYGQGEYWLEKLIRLQQIHRDKALFLHHVREINRGSALLTNDNEHAVPEEKCVHVTAPTYREEDLQGKISFHTIVDGLGCPWNKCAFCSHTRYFPHYRPRPIEEIIDEIKLMNKQGISFFRFSSSETPYAYGQKIAEAILAEQLSIHFSMFSRPSKPSEHKLQAYQTLIHAGLRAVFLGGETGHDIINSVIMNKGACKNDIVDTIQTIRDASKQAGHPCKVGLSLIYPCPVIPGVTLEDVFNENMALIEETLPDTVIVNPPGAFPGTRWFEQADQYGFKITDQFVYNLMEYEYSIYKPAELWQKLDYSLQGMNSMQIFQETGRLRTAIAAMGIPTDISDEYLMMMQAIGCHTKHDLMEFKAKTLIDVITGSVTYTKKIVHAINEKGRQIASTK